MSPSPLGTADSNVAVGVQANPSSKAVKRAAVANAGAGGEKRKKALKRL